MSLSRQSKSGLFLMELILNLLLFCILCSSALLFFTKSRRLSEDAAMLNNAVQITSSLAAIYETDKNGLSAIERAYPLTYTDQNRAILYFNREYQPCEKEAFYYSVAISSADSSSDCAEICFYDHENRPLYSIRAYHYTPATPQILKEVVKP